MARHRFQNRARYHLKMERLPYAVREELEKAVREAAFMLVAEMKAVAPHEDGDLRRSITAYPLRLKRLAATWRVAAGDETAFYARMVEFGTPRQTANPFFYPTYRRLRGRIRARFTAAIKRAVRRALAR